MTSDALLASVQAQIDAAKKEKEGGGGEHCDATAGLLESEPSGWDSEEDGEWEGQYMTAGDGSARLLTWTCVCTVTHTHSLARDGERSQTHQHLLAW